MFRLYVIQLDAAVRQSGKFRRANPAGGDECLYVGHTAKAPAERLAQHRAGIFSQGRWVQRFGAGGLRTDLAPDVAYATRQEAVEAEARLAAELRKRGFSVWSR